MSSRFLIGCDHMLPTPGVRTTRFSAAVIESCVTPSRHSPSGLRMAMVSIIDIGAMSVADSARPTLPRTVCTSGMLAIARSRWTRISLACVALTPGKSEGMSMIDPSLSGGMNSLPSLDQGSPVTTSRTAATPTVGQRCRSTSSITGR